MAFLTAFLLAEKLLLTGFRLRQPWSSGFTSSVASRSVRPRACFSLTFVWAYRGTLWTARSMDASSAAQAGGRWRTCCQRDGGYAPWFQGNVVDMFHFS